MDLQCALAYAKKVSPSSLMKEKGILDFSFALEVLLRADFASEGSNCIAQHTFGNLLIIDFKLTRLDLCPNLI
jgi:hypothetical protein